MLDCAKRKLAWEKQLASSQKRTPAVLERMAVLVGNSQQTEAEPRRLELLESLQRVQAAMERLQKATPQ